MYNGIPYCGSLGYKGQGQMGLPLQNILTLCYNVGSITITMLVLCLLEVIVSLGILSPSVWVEDGEGVRTKDFW